MDNRRVTYDNDEYYDNYKRTLKEDFYTYDNSTMTYGRNQYDSDISSDSIKEGRNRQISQLHTSFHAIPQQYPVSRGNFT